MDFRYEVNLFENFFPILKKCITPSWVYQTRNLMWENNTIVQESTLSLHAQRANDLLIMEDLIKEGFKGNELAELNRCWMYLKVTCLSDV